ncbi:IclR family transcriptional regulator [Modestobacter sp. URMC 112]
MSSLATIERLDLDEGDGCPKSVLGKVQLLLGAFGAGAFQLRLTELSRRSGVPKASAYRLAQELVQWGLLERQGDNYQLGIRVFELGQRVPVIAVLRSVSRPFLVDLFATTRATINLTVLDEAHVLLLEKVAGEANDQAYAEVGSRLPASCTATGKVLLAMRPEGEAVVRHYEAAGLPRATSRSVATSAALRGQLSEVRSRGYAVETHETLTGYGTVAVPVTGYDGFVHATVSATLPANRMSVPRLVPQLQGAAAGIGRAVDRRLVDRYDAVPGLSRAF